MKLFAKPFYLAVFALLVFSLLGTKDLSKNGFYTSHDGETHTARIAQYYQALKDGQFPPRFANSFYNGLGSPIFVYIYPAPYAFGSLLHLTGLSYVSSFKLLMFLGFFLSGVFAYLWLFEVFKSKRAAFLGALFYIWVPYRFSLIFVRGSISELLAYTFVPLVFYSVTKLSQKQNLKWVAISSLSISLVLLSQNLVALLSLPIVGMYVLILALKVKSKQFVIQAFLAAIWGFAIAQATYLPSAKELGFVRFTENISQTFIDHFVTIKQLVHSPWDYGFDLPGVLNDHMSFQIGLAHILIVLLAAVLSFVLLFKKSKRSTTLIFAIFFLTIFFVSVFLMIPTKPTVYIWQHFKPLQLIDIPWRLLGICALATSFLAAFVVKNIKPGVLFIFLFLFVIFANRNHLRINQARILDDDFFNNYTGTATQYNEFTPKSRQTTRVPEGFNLDIKVEVVEGNADISNLQSSSKEIKFDTNVTSDNSQVRINKFYFPQTVVLLDGKKLEPFREFTVTDASTLDVSTQKDASGLVQISIPKGNHSVLFGYKETKLRQLANMISAGALLLSLVIILKYAKA